MDETLRCAGAGAVARAPDKALAEGEDENMESEGPAVRVSITFKVACGAEGTKSRDFPGRHFRPRERDLLQDWAGQFRRGVPLTLNTPDLRAIQLPDALSGAKRRKPFNGITKVCRADAYHWYVSFCLSNFSPSKGS